MASFPLMYFLIFLVFPTILPEGMALKRTEKEPNISADLNDDFEISFCQTIRDRLDLMRMSRGSVVGKISLNYVVLMYCREYSLTM
ncbi:uncharacterized protein LOC100043300 precursor [Mus musculus]|uniref:Exocrine gland secreted peptide 16 n=1 Tax=Mus musculus TaxID=10090 RepID=A8R0U9_MOUSE|nr:uncharacterized protein LOC100043300 precursor [Mus musculus]BAF92732.1 exocrine gland-secreting peptide 16 [Mus musculus]|eukprot:NP_001242906.1 predicted gene 4345 precursor [Mus musculus]